MKGFQMPQNMEYIIGSICIYIIAFGIISSVTGYKGVENISS